MSDDRNDELLVAVELLTKPRKVPTIVPKGEYRAQDGVEERTLPPLITMLIDGLGLPNRAGSADIKIPIDAEALEMWGQIRDLIKLWCKKLHVAASDDLIKSVEGWHLAHANAYRSGRVSEVTNLDVTRMVQAWVRMIENKFDPPEKRDWNHHCVAETRNAEGETVRCGARRIVINGGETFAIQLNVTTLTAECRACGTQWVGEKQLAELRFLTNVDQSFRDGLEVDDAALRLLLS